MANQEITTKYVGAFYLEVIKQGKKLNFNVVSFILQKLLGKLPYANVSVADVTENNSVEVIKTNFPKLSSIKELYKSLSIGKGGLLDCRLVQIQSKGSGSTQKQWFRGKLATITPFVSMESGISTGMTCYCLSKACQLMFSIHADFIYAPAALARSIRDLESYQVFSGNFMKKQTFYQSRKLNITKLISASGATAKDNLLDMAQKALNKLSNWQQATIKDQAVKDALPVYKLKEYFKSTWYLAERYYKYNASTGLHPYVNDFCYAFLNSYMSSTILDSFLDALTSDWRMLTVAPPARGEQDKLVITPTFNSPLTAFTLTANDMLSCNVAASPITHLKTPDRIYTRSPIAAAWSSPDDKGYSNAHGTYEMQSSKNNKNLKVKVIDTPSWLLNTLLQQARTQEKNQKSGNKKQETSFRNLTAQDMMKKNPVPAQTPTVTTKGLQMLDDMAKTIFIHFFLRNKQASINMVVSQKTLDIDKYIGKAIRMQIPIQASQLGNKADTFYGVVSSVRYQYHASESPRSMSSMSVTCSVTGVTWKDDRESAQLYQKAQKNLLYTEDKPA